MATTVNLLLKASTNFISDDLINRIENGVKQSSCWIKKRLNSENELHFQIKAFTDKLEKLYMQLHDSGLELVDGSAEMIKNASTQYSVFRDIEITLVVSEPPNQIIDEEFALIAGKVL
jgi:hypothetical protein